MVDFVDLLSQINYFMVGYILPLIIFLGIFPIIWILIGLLLNRIDRRNKSKLNRKRLMVGTSIGFIFGILVALLHNYCLFEYCILAQLLPPYFSNFWQDYASTIIWGYNFIPSITSEKVFWFYFLF